MDDGIYHVRFKAEGGPPEEGIAVLIGDRVNGGDPVCLYRGTYNPDNEVFKVEVVRHNKGKPTVFGDELDHYTFTLKRDKSENWLLFSGPVEKNPKHAFSGPMGENPEHTITVELTWLGPIA